jgi:hypothetical protein
LQAGRPNSTEAELLISRPDQAILVITHDFNCLDQVDEIIVLDRRTVAELGSHAALTSAGGLCAALRGAAAARESEEPDERADHEVSAKNHGDPGNHLLGMDQQPTLRPFERRGSPGGPEFQEDERDDDQ